ncbi:MAG: hypothetical protein IJ887_05605 [Prevotella sp.]|nr:hypothetical protein [Prevotella sp.]
MKRKFFFMLVALLATVAVQAQQISVVAEDGTTSMYRTLQEAIEGASGGSVVYLPGGGFSIADSVKITKKLTIIGIGHKVKGANADGNTTISGNLFFNEGSSGSAVMGCYITGNINIGDGNAEVNDIFIKCCNLNSVQVKSAAVTGTFINQNYIRSLCNFGGSVVTLKNNITHRIKNVKMGIIQNNCILGPMNGPNDYDCAISSVYDTIFDGNIFYGSYDKLLLNYWLTPNSGNQNITNLYCCAERAFFYTNENDVATIEATPSDLFNNYNNWIISPSSNFHFKEAYQQYESLCGIYAGTGFDDGQMPPVPYISSKYIPGETDASGKLHIQVTVNAK